MSKDLSLNTPKVTLLDFPADILEKMWILWEQSKGERPLEDITREAYKLPREKLEELFWKVLVQRIPIGEHFQFVFVIENISISWREQAVRHRIGTKVGDNVGVDIVPDLASSSWWSQSMRIQDMGTFATRGLYRVPATIKGKTVDVRQGTAGSLFPLDNEVDAERLYNDTMDLIEDSYNKLVAAGVPMEDARELIPLGAQHRMSWAINLQSLLHVLGKRGCWILQMGIWGPVILGMVEELAKKVHPLFQRIVAPPCVDNTGRFGSCEYRLENQRRLTGDDNHAPCPLYLARDEDGAKRIGFTDADSLHSRVVQLKANGTPIPIPRHAEMVERAEDYRTLWGKSPYTYEIKEG